MQRPTQASLDGGESIPPAIHEPNATLSEAIGLSPKLRQRYLTWLRVSGQHEMAARLLAMIERSSGESAALLEERAALALAAGDAPAVRDCWQRRLAASPSPSARASFARALLELGEIDAATIAAELQAEHGELATVRALAAEVALLHGDSASARDHWSAQLTEDSTRIAPHLALARIAAMRGALDEARLALDRATADLSALTAAQVASAAALAEMLAQPSRAQALRLRYTRLEAARAATLATEIDTALGRSTRPAPNGSTGVQSSPPLGQDSDPGHSHGSALPDQVVDESLAETATVPIAEEEPIADDRVLETLRDVFGHSSLRPGQSAVINRVLAGRDVLAIMPTGAGKSLTFQLSALLLPGTTLVISPLIALMKDQVEVMPDGLRERTVLVNSTLSPSEQQRAVDEIAAGRLKLVYAAPERLRQHSFLRALRQAGVSLVVVDEAHCISLWGHDFRPDYLTIPAALPELDNSPVLAITATATPRMETAIAAGFGRDLDRVRTSVFRPNLHYEVHRLPGREQKVAKVLDICRQERGAGIVYVSSRKDAEAIAALLRNRGVNAEPYHAGLDPTTRARNQERYMRGQIRVVVATVAFGMGVDKRDVRFIVHLNPPRSLEAYAQESGRAGRDGQPARCVLLVAPADQASLNRLARRDELDIDTLRRVYVGVQKAARGRWAIVDPGALLAPSSFDAGPDDEADPRIALGLLEQANLIRRHPDAPVTYSVHVGPSSSEDSISEPTRDPLFAQLTQWSGLDAPGRTDATFRTADACDHLDLSPLELGRLLASHPALSVREGPRLVCLEILPAGHDAALRLNANLSRSRSEAQARIRQVMTYASGDQCRHVALAKHLGEALPPCGVSCDICLNTADGAGIADESGHNVPAARLRFTSADALAVLHAVRTFPFPMGKPGLTKLLLGSVESHVHSDRSPAFGALSGFKRGKVEGLIDRLVEDGFLFRDLDHEYKLIRLTERGAAATLDDLANYDEASPPSDVTDLSPEDQIIFARLRDWRLERASRDAVAPFIIAHNAWLVALAQMRPETLEDLAGVKGFGQSRVDKYGEEILAIIAEAGALASTE